MRVNILSDRSFRNHTFIYPVRVFSRSVRQLGIEVKTYYDQNDRALTECDVLLVLSDYFGLRHLKQEGATVAEWLAARRNEVKALIWGDVTDGTGKFFLEAFPVVDVYAKKQLLRDRQLYAQPFFERSYHLDFYYQHFGPELEAIGRKETEPARGLEAWEIDKLGLTWNIGLGDYNTFWGRGRNYRSYWPLSRYKKKLASAQSQARPVHVSYRASINYSQPAVSFHRKEAYHQLQQLADTAPLYNLAYQGRVPYKQYLQELTRTAIAVSPFGWGEICWRDFESLLCGAMIYKPDMSHLETWPDYYQDGITYAAYNWDYSDFQAKTLDLLSSPDKWRAIACAGQDYYLNTLSPDGGRAFALHFQTMVEQALAARKTGLDQ